MIVPVLVGQFPISGDISRNLKVIFDVIDEAEPDSLVVLPEGSLSGYSDDVTFLDNIDLGELGCGLKDLKQRAIDKGVHLIFGSCIFEEGYWYNAGIYFGPDASTFIYRKVNLATHERGHFDTGNELPVLELKIKGDIVKVGIQLCREIRFPEQWRWLAANGAQVLVYLTNAVNGDGASVWRSHLISRAAENQRFVLSANNAHDKQICPTMAISPSGKVMDEVLSDQIRLLKTNLDVQEVSDWYVSQCREDVIRLQKGEITITD